MLFVGTVVGAGFATGREITLFFGEDGSINIIIAALAIGMLCWCFLSLGSKKVLERRNAIKSIWDIVIAVTSFATYATMIAAANGLLYEAVGIRWLGVIPAVICAVTVMYSLKGLEAVNCLAVPVMIAMIIFVSTFAGELTAFNSIKPITAIAYGAMNMLSPSALMYEEGKTMSPPKRLIAAVVSAVISLVLLLLMYKCIGQYHQAEMPFLAACTANGYGTLAIIILLLAILTTMASCNHLAHQTLKDAIGCEWLSITIILFAGLIVSLTGFALLVDTLYPLISYLGLLVSLAAAALLIFNRSCFPIKNKGIKH